MTRARSLRQSIFRVVLLVVVAVFLFVGCYVGRLFFGQWQMIYHPQKYETSYRAGLPRGTVELEYETSQGNQVAFYVPPRDGATGLPDTLWVMFHGNASRALDWLDMVEAYPWKEAGFLLIDYPGYGKCEGKPKSGRILENSECSVDALAAHLEVDRNRLEEEMSIMGFSIGGATCLQFAAHHPMKRLVLISTFTSLKDMAKLQVGSLLSNLLLEKYDNRVRLAEIARRPNPPDIHIFHGEDDNVVPFSMGEELAGAHPEQTTFHPIKNIGHGGILDTARKEIYQAMIGGPAARQ